MDVGLPLCQSCYRLEGDGYLAVIAFDEINVLSSLLMHHPLACAEAVASKIAQERYPLAADMPQRHQLRDNLMLEAQACVRPALAYLDDRFVSEAPNGLKRVKDVFEACRLCNPCRINDIPVDPTLIKIEDGVVEEVKFEEIKIIPVQEFQIENIPVENISIQTIPVENIPVEPEIKLKKKKFNGLRLITIQHENVNYFRDMRSDDVIDIKGNVLGFYGKHDNGYGLKLFVLNPEN